MSSEKLTNNSDTNHLQEYVAIDLNPESKVRFIFLTFLTLIVKKNNIRQLRDAQIYLQDIKSVFMQRKQEQRNENFEILKNLTSAIKSLQQFCNRCLDKIIANLKQQEASIVKEQEQELFTQLQSLDLYCYFSQSIQLNKSDLIKNTIETQIQNLNIKDLIHKFLGLLQLIEDSSITLDSVEQLIYNEIKEIQRAPYFHLTWEYHKKEIVFFDFDNSKVKENRICQIQFIKNKHAEYTSLDSAFDQWQKYENKKKQFLLSQLESGKQKIEIAQLSLEQVSNQFEQKINQTKKKLANKLLLIQVQNQEQLDTLNRNWQKLAKDENIEIADLLCQNHYQAVVNQQSEDEQQKLQEQVNNFIQNSLKYLNDTLSNFIYKIDKFNQRQLSNSGSIVAVLETQYILITVTFKKSKRFTHRFTLQDQSIIKLKETSVIDLTIFRPQMKLEFFEKKISTQKEISEQLCKKLKQLEEEKSILCRRNQDSIEQLHQYILLQGQQKDKQIKQLNEQIQSLDAEKNKAIEKLAYAIDKLNQLQKENEEIKQINEELLNKTNKLEDSQKNHQIKILEYQKQVQNIENEKQEQLKLSTNQLIITQHKLSKLQEELNKTNQKIFYQDNQLEQLNKQIIFHKAEKDSNLEASQSLINRLMQQSQILEIEKQKLIYELDMQIKLIQEQKSEIIQLKQYNQEAIQQLTKQNHDENSRNLKLIEEHKTTNQKQEESLQKMQIKIESLNKQIKQYQEQLQQSQHQQDILNKQIDKLKDVQKKIDQINLNLNKNNQDKDEQINQQQQKIKQLFEEKSRSQDKIIEEIKQKQIINPINSPYEIIKEYSKKQQDLCYAITFNKEQTIMLAGCGSKITVFEFKEGQLNQKQLLSDHASPIFTQYFMSKQNQFISGAYKEIGIWSQKNTTQQWYCLQLLKQAHSNWVNRVIMNKNEDLIISCSDDKTIKFWIQKKEWECLQTQTNHKNSVNSICLNESCTQLVSCGGDKMILISQQGGDQKWIVIQSISVYKWGIRICFIDDNIIVFQPFNETIMETYQLDQQRRQFIKSKDITVQNDSYCSSLFPIQFNNNKQLLLNKNDIELIQLGNRIKTLFLINQLNLIHNTSMVQ